MKYVVLALILAFLTYEVIMLIKDIKEKKKNKIGSTEDRIKKD